MKLKTILVEDERKSRDTLRHMLAEFCPEVELIGEAMTIEEARKIIEQEKLDLVFLDIELPQQNGFHLFVHYPKPEFEVVFTTAYDQYALQAFQIAAIDYLLKPIDIKLLQEAVNRVLKKRALNESDSRLEILNSNYKQKEFGKIALPSNNGYIFMELKNIVACEASRSYTTIYLEDGEKILISKPLKFLEVRLCNLHFFRISRSYIINLHFLKSYTRTHRGEVILTNGMTLAISEEKKKAFLERLNF